MDVSGQFLSVSNAWIRLLGLSREQFLAFNYLDFLHPDDLVNAQQHLTKIVQESIIEHFFCHNRYQSQDGEIKYFKWYSRFDRENNIIFNFTVDSTQEYQKIELIEQLQTSAQIGHYRCDIAGDSFNLYWSSQTYIIHELEINTPVTVEMAINFYHPDFIPLIQNCVEMMLKHGAKYDQDFKIITARGNEKWVRAIGNPQYAKGKIVGFWGTFQDINEQKIKSQNLELFKKAIESTSDGVIITSSHEKDYEVIYVNPNFEKITGYTSPDVLGKSCMNLLQKSKFYSNLLNENLKDLRIKKIPIELKYEQFKSDGTIFLNELGIAPILNELGQPEYYVGNFHDITDTDRDNFLLQQINRIAKIGLWSANLKEKHITFHHSSFDLFGQSQMWKERIPFTHFNKVLGENNKDLIDNIINCIKSNKVFSEIISMKLTPESDVSFFKFFAHSFYENEIIGLMQDVSDITRTQAELDLVRINNVNSSRLSALGEMAAGIAHEINNPLMVISASIDVLTLLISKSNISSTEINKYSKQISDTVKRISKILNAMKKISRLDEDINVADVSIKAIVDDLEHLTISRFRHAGVQLSFELDPSNVSVLANEISLTQVLLNLLNNAYDEVIKKELNQRWIKIVTKHKDSTLIIDVIDSGSGVPNDLIDKLFNPFFTTKEIGKGTGIGLSISKALMQKMHGDISYHKIDGNTCFRLELPIK